MNIYLQMNPNQIKYLYSLHSFYTSMFLKNCLVYLFNFSHANLGENVHKVSTIPVTVAVFSRFQCFFCCHCSRSDFVTSKRIVTLCSPINSLQIFLWGHYLWVRVSTYDVRHRQRQPQRRVGNSAHTHGMIKKIMFESTVYFSACALVCFLYPFIEKLLNAQISTRRATIQLETSICWLTAP